MWGEGRAAPSVLRSARRPETRHVLWGPPIHVHDSTDLPVDHQQEPDQKDPIDHTPFSLSFPPL